MLIKKHCNTDKSLYNENVWIGDSFNKLYKGKNIIYTSGNPEKISFPSLKDITKTYLT